MAAPFLDTNASLDTLRDDLKWLSRRLHRHEHARSFAERIDALLAEWPALHNQQLQCWDVQRDTQVDVTIADEDLDDAVDAFHATVLASVDHDRTHARYRAWFRMPPGELKRFVLGAELDAVRAWIPMLDAETHEALRGHRARLTACVEAADAAVAARAEADARNAGFRTVGALADYVRRVVETRDQVWAELERRRTHDTKGELPRDWATRFFKARSSRVSEAEKTVRAAERAKERETREAVAARRKELQANLKKTQADLSALQKNSTRRRRGTAA